MTRRFILLLGAALLLIRGAAFAQASGAEPPLRILISNDDGYLAPGLVALVDSLIPVARVTVAAPLEQQSGAGHAITFRDPIRVVEYQNRYRIPWYGIAATPATCTRLALYGLLDSLPDLVISGINAGDNLAASVWVSGTVGAAREGAMRGIPAIAVSLDGGRDAEYGIAAGYVRQLVEQLRAGRLLEAPLLLNVNVPAGQPKGARVGTASLSVGEQRYERRTSPRGGTYFWDVWSPPKEDVEGTDLYWFARGYVTITPLLLDQTDGDALRSWSSRLSR